MNPTNKVIERIKKLLELTTSPNENEAQRAMEQAQKLMIKYSISEYDLTSENNLDSADQIELKISRSEYWNSAFMKQGVWEQMPRILQAITPIFGVYTIVYRPHYDNPTQLKQRTRFELIGFPANIEIARFAVDSILAQGQIEAKAEYKKYKTVGFGISFWSGFATGLYRKFGKFSDAKENNELVVYDKVKQYINSIAKGTFESKIHDGVAFDSGVNAGLKAEIRRGIEQKNEGKLLN